LYGFKIVNINTSSSEVDHRIDKMQYFVAVLVLLFGTIASGELTEFFNYHYEIRGVYKNENGSLGIKFTSREGALHIKNLDDVTLTYFNSANEINKRMARSIYILDSEYLQHQNDGDRHLDGPKDDDTMPFNDAMQQLLQMEEVYLLDDAAHAVGKQGITGVNTPAAMPFFIIICIEGYSDTILWVTSVQ